MTATAEYTDPVCQCGRSLDELNVVEADSYCRETGYREAGLRLVCNCSRVYDEDDVAARYEALEAEEAA